jgi:hypothetical protein
MTMAIRFWALVTCHLLVGVVAVTGAITSAQVIAPRAETSAQLEAKLDALHRSSKATSRQRSTALQAYLQRFMDEGAAKNVGLSLDDYLALSPDERKRRREQAVVQKMVRDNPLGPDTEYGRAQRRYNDACLRAYAEHRIPC